ncbi:Spx/MgsR family RNA polymerase-binding regulatory protein [Rossellomorea marisflavi]|uniref:Transcriptional regulator n=1 Tax=Rossellomorea marisflavi TaxID=189381 RepID=A0A0J5SEZ3_9BACI|nr:Spx/MgsR family RNA polymerase-binding regulatory protein [Rossellomorea marisflavi]KMK93797.1 regulatory protein MgsR [Rossellomorea marisflavi]KML07149.1 regulatory protein MgsR [Rossellomorea marisflavi]KML34718.1 regulatory protein MgsR [Rossellomorea marisflavi]KZE45772.1 transcriptional regulator [Rossellomorea marisflavi]MCM2606074.1 Spx/MgsR family RNA polymerase-binding regulatory protein [Rossellomorea marisflavi]
MDHLTFYTYPSCTSCRKAKKWLTANAVDFNERHLFRETPSPEELMNLLALTTEGLDEILATRSQTFKDLGKDVNDLPLSEVIQLIVKEPKLLRRPLLTDGKKLVVGYNPEGLQGLASKKRALKKSS